VSHGASRRRRHPVVPCIAAVLRSHKRPRAGNQYALVELRRPRRRPRCMLRVVCIAALAMFAAACSSSHHSSSPSPSTTPRTSAPPSSTNAVPASACSLVSGGAAARPAGYITGQLREVGGPSGGARPVSGRVVAVETSKARCQVAVGPGGSFAMQLVPGTYTLTGRSPSYGDGTYECFSQAPVRVMARLDISQAPPPFISVNCSIR
jgi:hypothetical protein